MRLILDDAADDGDADAVVTELLPIEFLRNLATAPGLGFRVQGLGFRVGRTLFKYHTLLVERHGAIQTSVRV